jgi:hypothetical protein
MKSALFINWTEKDFTGYWNGKGKEVKAGEKLWMPDYLARHFAKHLTNRELLKTDSNGNLIYKDGDKMTSPKFPEQVPLYVELFNKAFQMDETEDMMGDKKDDIETLIDVANKNRAQGSTETVAPPEPQDSPKNAQDPTQPQIIEPSVDDEEEFEGKPFEGSQTL